MSALLKKALQKKNIMAIRDASFSMSDADIAKYVENLDTNNALVLFRSLNQNKAADVFTELSQDIQEKLIEKFSDETTKNIFNELFADEAADIIDEMPPEIIEKILKNTSKEKRDAINTILNYTDDQTGSIMSVDIIKLNESWTISRALKEIKSKIRTIENVRHYYVQNDNGNLVGMVTLENLTFGKPNSSVKKIMEFTPYVKTRFDKELTTNEFLKQDFSELPVVNTQNVLVGMVTADDILDVVVEEYTEDSQIAAGIKPIVDTPYLKTSVMRFVRSRIFWLFFLMFSATLTQTVLQIFITLLTHLNGSPVPSASSSIASASVVTLLVSIIPDISGTSGNAGSQASTVVSRSIALGEVSSKNFKGVFFKELKIGACSGTILGIANFIRLILYYIIYAAIINSPPLSHNNYQDLWIALGASIAMFFVVVFAKVVGGLLPLLATKIKIDPASMSAPLLTTICDAISIVIFFLINIGILLLAGIL